MAMLWHGEANQASLAVEGKSQVHAELPQSFGAMLPLGAWSAAGCRRVFAAPALWKTPDTHGLGKLRN